jgi:hypothetical protein
MHLVEHLLFEILTNPGAALYVVVTGFVTVYVMKSGWWFLSGWVAVPFMIVTAAICLPILACCAAYLIQRHGWPEFKVYRKNPNAYLGAHPNSALAADHRRWAKRFSYL